MTLTTVSSLLQKYSIDPNSIGRLEVGTESPLDKSKSCKTVLMQLFEPCGNTNVEGVDTVNACYGGTNALFNAINWVESSAWDGRDAIVVMGDISVYKDPAARPTGGAGCVAMLIGPNAPIVFDPGMRGSYMKHVYDFYKADLASEYPLVDGHFSNACYIEAIDNCSKNYQTRLSHGRFPRGKTRVVNGVTTVNGLTNGASDGTKNDADEANGHEKSPRLFIDNFDYMAFHSPNCKLVAKSYARLLYNDFRANPDDESFSSVVPSIRELDYQSSLTNKEAEKTFMKLSQSRFKERVEPSLLAASMCGNMYCASVYACVVSLICNVPPQDLLGKKLGIFSYGSGLASSFFSATVKGDTSFISDRVNLQHRLNARQVVSPVYYDEVCSFWLLGGKDYIDSMTNSWVQMCKLREEAYLKKNYAPQGDIKILAKETYYLTGVDDRFRRSYEIQK